MSPLLVTLWGLLVAACLPVVMRFMLPPVPPFRQRGEPACVLVLGAGRKRQKTLVEGARVQLSSRSLTRLEMGLSLARQKKLPMLLSGGAAGFLAGKTEAELMADLVKPRIGSGLAVWQEHISHNTYENALFSARLLQQKGIGQVYLVTDASHLCRAMLCLRKQGIVATPYPCRQLPEPGWLPHVGVLLLWPDMLYEWLALGWYFVQRRF